MSQLRERSRNWLITRICLGCGYSGPELQRTGEEAVWACPCCGEDLYARRPQSYAELEGLVGDGGVALPDAGLMNRGACRHPVPRGLVRRLAYALGRFLCGLALRGSGGGRGHQDEGFGEGLKTRTRVSG